MLYKTNEKNKIKKLEFVLEPKYNCALDFISSINSQEYLEFINENLIKAFLDFSSFSKSDSKVDEFFEKKLFFWEFSHINVNLKPHYKTKLNLNLDKNFRDNFGYINSFFQKDEDLINFSFDYIIQSFIDSYNKFDNYLSIDLPSRVNLAEEYMKNPKYYSAELNFLKNVKYIAGFSYEEPIIVKNRENFLTIIQYSKELNKNKN